MPTQVPTPCFQEPADRSVQRQGLVRKRYWAQSRHMTIPKYHKLLTTVLQSLADGREWRARDFYQHVIDGLDFPEQERTEKCGGGGSSDGDPAVDQRSLAVPSGAGAISRHFFVGAAATSQYRFSVDREVTSAQWRVS